MSNRPDPTEWANRRKAAMERAKQLREERKHGTTNESDHTFAPQINKRPSYLNKQDSLDALAAQTSSAVRPDDPMEQPLPGARRQQPELPSPGSDTLGRELKRFPGGSAQPSQQAAAKGNDGQGGGTGQYRSKFMQQYQQPSGPPAQAAKDVGSPFKNEQTRSTSNKIENADDTFMNMLRSDGTTSTKRRESGPGWNDDTTFQTDAFGNNNKVASRATGKGAAAAQQTNNAPTRGRRTSIEPQQPPQQRQQQTTPQQRQNFDEGEDRYVGSGRRNGGQSDVAPTKPAAGRRAPQPLPDWNSDFDANGDSGNDGGGGGGYAANYAAQKRGGTTVSPRNGGGGGGGGGHGGASSGLDKVSQHPPRQATSPRDGYGEGFNASTTRATRITSDPAVSQARSRLSLLKSKMRRSESSGGTRTSAARDDDNGSLGGDSVENMRRTAPMAVGGGGRGGTVRGAGTSSNDPYGPDAYPPGGAAPAAATMGGSRPSRRQGAAAAAAAAAAKAVVHDDYDDEDGGGGGGGYSAGNGNGRGRGPYGDYAESVPKSSSVAAANGHSRSRQQQQSSSYSSGYGNDRYQDEEEQDSYQPQPRQTNIRNGNRGGSVNAGAGAGSGGGRPPSSGTRPPSSNARGGGGGGGGTSSSIRGGGSGVAMNDDPYGAPPMGMGMEDDGPGELLECPDCGRKFGPIPFEKHVKICAKVFLQKRKVFDSKKMRVADNPELVQILKKKEKDEKKTTGKQRQSMGGTGVGGGGGRAAAAAAAAVEQPIGGGDNGKAAKAAKWKEDSKRFREAMKAARQVTQAIASGAPLPPPVISAPDPSLVLCPHCSRRFNDKAAERHIPKCQDIRAKPTSLRRGAGGGGGVNGSTQTMKVNRGKMF